MKNELMMLIPAVVFIVGTAFLAVILWESLLRVISPRQMFNLAARSAMNNIGRAIPFIIEGVLHLLAS